MTGNDRKRSNPSGSHGGGGNKRKKVLGQCLRPRTRSLTHTQGNAWKQGYSITGIEAGFKGIFATCDRGKEGKCVSEMYGLLEDCAEKLYGLKNGEEEDAEQSDDGGIEDIEAALKKEMAELEGEGKKKKDKKIASVKIDADCVLFFRLKSPCDPVEMVTELCKSAQTTGNRRMKFLSRLTPVELTGKATLESIEKVAATVLKPHFHDGQEGLKFAIRPTSRNHHVLKRDEIIRCVAKCVGPKHTVDLKNYDLLILVEIYKNICGISVVKDFEKYRKFNLRELQSCTQPSSDEQPIDPVKHAAKNDDGLSTAPDTATATPGTQESMKEDTKPDVAETANTNNDKAVEGK
ncbi:hypothetical protein EX30DRAFT_306517 [Ascodesmis nigricans]|uniref:THUMP domain-containing protein n=1 Tax=Ascodesmis nigricans TaxID=341454 RepID=A0A4S2MX99_9PEZI|nr:hypothetical protein EX30DRAFT_306517 [Ascodesmis nigricans]